MWMLVARTPRPDASYWPGRRWIAALDAVGWPAAWTLAVAYAPQATGVVGIIFIAWAALSALGRLHRALWNNQRYRFTTWRWGRVVAAMLVLGFAMKLAASL